MAEFVEFENVADLGMDFYYMAKVLLEDMVPKFSIIFMLQNILTKLIIGSLKDNQRLHIQA